MPRHLFYVLLRFLDDFEAPDDANVPGAEDGVSFLDILVKNFWWAALIIVVVTVGVIWLVYFRKSRKKPQPMSEESIVYVIDHLGGIENLKGASQDGARLAFTLKNLKRADLDAIKDLGAMGIFVAGNTIKLMFPFDASALIDRIQADIAGGAPS